MQNATARDALLRLATRHQLPRIREALAPTRHLHRGLADVEQQLRGLLREDSSAAALSARHLLASGGKRVRPMLCLLAARAFPPGEPHPGAEQLAFVAEAIHGATLLHDDVLDLGDTRRGRPTARRLFGNNASVLGGDLLLVEALAAVQQAGLPELMGSLLGVLSRLVAAEAMQLDNRGRVDLDPDEYFAVVDGKTASLFEWALEAGGRCGGASEAQVEALRLFGSDVGYAFQLLDDLLDLTRDPDALGKGVLQDLAGGTVTFPVLLALQGRPALADRLARVARGDDDDAFVGDLLEAVDRSGAVLRTRERIGGHTSSALARLGSLPRSAAREALAEIAGTLARRAR
jgi:octaprenyl-diphosphate synthase